MSLFDKKKMQQDLSFIPTVVAWLVIPFVPLYLSLPHPVLFYLILCIYVVLFLVMNNLFMHYSMTEICVFLFLFLFCAYVAKTLSDEGVIEGKEIVKTGITLGTF